MTESAITHRDRRMADTAHQLTLVSRRMTAELGLSGFTLEQLCDEVGISRRTFFNYFPSKQEAVVGFGDNDSDERLLKAFLAKGTSTTGHIPTTVLDDLVELAAIQFDEFGQSPAEITTFIAALKREPKIFARLSGRSEERDAKIAAAIEQRFGLEPGDNRARATTIIIMSLVRSSLDQYISAKNSSTFPELLTSALTAARAVFGSTNTENIERQSCPNQ